VSILALVFQFDKLWAGRRIGELSRELEKAPQASGGRHPITGKPTKTEALTAAGISTSAAQRYEQLPEIPEKIFEAYIEICTCQRRFYVKMPTLPVHP